MTSLRSLLSTSIITTSKRNASAGHSRQPDNSTVRHPILDIIDTRHPPSAIRHHTPDIRHHTPDIRHKATLHTKAVAFFFLGTDHDVYVSTRFTLPNGFNKSLTQTQTQTRVSTLWFSLAEQQISMIIRSQLTCRPKNRRSAHLTLFGRRSGGNGSSPCQHPGATVSNARVHLRRLAAKPASGNVAHVRVKFQRSDTHAPIQIRHACPPKIQTHKRIHVSTFLSQPR